MADRTIDVVTANKPWVLITQHAILGNLDGALGITGEYGLAAGEDLSDETLPNLVFSDDTRRIQFRGEDEGCLTFDDLALSGIHAPTDDALDISVRGSRLLRLDADEGLSIWDASGDAVLAIRRHGDAYSTGADIHAAERLGLSADSSVGVYIDTLNETTDATFTVKANADTWEDSQALLYVHEAVRMGMRLPDIATDTSIVPFTDVFFDVTYDTEDAAAPGGAIIRGVKDSQSTAGEEGGALQMRGLLEDDVEVGKNTTARSLVEVYGAQLSGGSLANVIANGNVFSVRAYVGAAWTNCIIVDEDGDLYYRGALVAFDEEDDAQALSDLYHILTGEPEKAVRYTRSRLHEMGVLGSDGNDALLSTHGATALTMGAARQINERQRTLIQAANTTRQGMVELEQRIDTLEAGRA